MVDHELVSLNNTQQQRQQYNPNVYPAFAAQHAAQQQQAAVAAQLSAAQYASYQPLTHVYGSAYPSMEGHAAVAPVASAPVSAPQYIGGPVPVAAAPVPGGPVAVAVAMPTAAPVVANGGVVMGSVPTDRIYSGWAWTSIIVFILFIVANLLTVIQYGVFYPLLFIPFIAFYRWAKKSNAINHATTAAVVQAGLAIPSTVRDRIITVDELVRGHAVGYFLLGWPFSWALSGVTFLALVDSESYNHVLGRRIAAWVVPFLFVALEETVKYIYYNSSLAKRTATQDTLPHRAYTTATAYGHALASTVAVASSILAYLILNTSHDWKTNNEIVVFTYQHAAGAFFVSFVLMFPTQLITSYVINMKIAERRLVPSSDVRLYQIVGLPIVLRSLVAYALRVLASPWFRHHVHVKSVIAIGAIALAVQLLFFYLPMIAYVRRQEKKLPEQYKMEVGVMDGFGSLCAYTPDTNANVNAAAAAAPVAASAQYVPTVSVTINPSGGVNGTSTDGYGYGYAAGSAGYARLN